MRKLLLFLFALMAISPIAYAQQIQLKAPAAKELTQGHSYPIEWNSSGIKSVSIRAEGTLTSYPGNSRGEFQEIIADKIPASQGMANWKVPFLDTPKFRILLKGYNEQGQMVAQDSRVYAYRPKLLASRKADGIYVDLRTPQFQRLYVVQNGIVTHTYLASGGRSRKFFSADVHPKRPHDHEGVFHVLQKQRSHWSKLYQVTMVYSLRFLNGHYIHGTTPNEYYKLGRAASAGCVRLHRADARELYAMTPIGTRLEIVGPGMK